MARRRRRPKAGQALLALWAGAVLATLAYLFSLPDVRPLKRANPRSTAFIELRRLQAARQGKPFELRMVWTRWEDFSPHLKNAVLTAEDDMFYRHNGVDWEGTRIALAKDWERKRLAFGGSTITQQVARNLYLSPSKNPLRKIKEFLIARRLERELGKRRIFELYLNIAEWGKGIFGAEAASRAYFGKPSSELTPDEAVAMAVVLPNPRRWRPVGESRYVERNKRRILTRMKASGFLPEEEEEIIWEDASELTVTEPAGDSPFHVEAGTGSASGGNTDAGNPIDR